MKRLRPTGAGFFRSLGRPIIPPVVWFGPDRRTSAGEPSARARSVDMDLQSLRIVATAALTTGRGAGASRFDNRSTSAGAFA